MPTTEKADRSEEQRVKLGELREVLNTDVGRKAASQLFQGGELSGPEHMLAEAYLRRWLRARRWKVDVAAKSILAHAEWRATAMPTGRVEPAQVPNELACEKVYMLGSDKNGRAVLLVQVRKHNLWKRKMEELERFVCFCLDAAVRACDAAANPRGHIAVVLDLTDLGTLSLDVPAVSALFKLLGEHYVERLGVMVMYNPSLIFWGAWNTLSPLLPPETRQKILVVDTKERSALIELVGTAVLPLQYGGEATGLLVPIS